MVRVRPRGRCHWLVGQRCCSETDVLVHHNDTTMAGRWCDAVDSSILPPVRGRVYAISKPTLLPRAVMCLPPR